MMSSRRADHVLLDHGAPQIIGSGSKSSLSDLKPLGEPRYLEVQDIVQVETRNRQPAEVFCRLHPAGQHFPERRVVGLKRPEDEGNEAAGPVLKRPKLLEVLEAVDRLLALTKHHRCRGRDPEL